jgi:DNA-binding response OmpR family regulator
MAHLILLEDENILRKEISGYLAESGHQIDSVSNINDFRNTFRPDSHLIALIDLSLPDGDGLELIAHLRAQGDQHGIIVITALQRRLESGRVTLYWRIDAAKRQLIPPAKRQSPSPRKATSS